MNKCYSRLGDHGWIYAHNNFIGNALVLSKVNSTVRDSFYTNISWKRSGPKNNIKNGWGNIVDSIMVLQKGKKGTQAQSPYPPMPPYPYPPPPRRRKRRRKKEPKEEKKTEVKKEAKIESEEPVQVENDSNGANGAPVSAAQIAAMESQDLTSNDISTPVVDDPNVLKSEIDDIRKSVVSMSVGQPARTSTIVKEWLEQPAPESSTPAPEEQSNDDSGGGEEEESGEE